MKRKKIGERSFWYFLFMLPNLLLYGIFGIFPIALGIFYSFTDWNGIAKSWKMVGLGNYIKMLHDSRFLRAMRFIYIYAPSGCDRDRSCNDTGCNDGQNEMGKNLFPCPFISFRLF